MFDQIFKSIQKYFPAPPKRHLQDWDFIFVFQEYYKGEIEIMFSALKCQQDIQWTVVDNPLQKQALFLIKMSDKVVQNMAHQLKILKIKNKRSTQLKLKDINLMIYSTDKNINPSLYNYLCFLRARLSSKSKQVFQQQKYSAFNKYKLDKYQKDEKGKLFTSQQQLRAKYHFLLTYSQQIKIKSSIADLGIEDTSKQPFNNIMKHPGFIELVPIQKVSQHSHFIVQSLKDNVGPNIDCYFQFVSFLQKWLVFPMIVGLLVIFFNSIFQYTADNSPFDFIYALVIMLWSLLFITRWEQLQKWTKIKQTGGRSQIWTEHQQMISKKDFQKHYSLVTGQIEYHLPLKFRIILNIVSNFICYSMMMGTLIFIVYSLNARGFIDPEHKLFYSETVSSWAASGGIFDSNTLWGQIPNIVHVLVTNGFDQNVYRPAVKKLAKQQRHQSRKSYQNSIILKYFIYEFVITFADLFYIAFVRFDIQGLREQLVSLFFIDIIRRVIAESVIPWAKRYKQKRDSLIFLSQSNLKNKLSEQQKQKIRKSLNTLKRQMSQRQQLQWGAINQVNKQDYQPFDDYLQIITNIGYLVMISSCFPLAPTLILIAHQVQLFQDKYKVIHIFKRKLPSSYVGMGRWKNIIVFICYISIVTNIMLFAFSSQQVVSYFPMMYEGGKDLLYGNTDLTTLIGAAATGLFVNLNDLVSQNSTQLNQQIQNNSSQQIHQQSMFPDILVPSGSSNNQKQSGSSQNKNEIIINDQKQSQNNKRQQHNQIIDQQKLICHEGSQQSHCLHPTQSSIHNFDPPPFIVKQFKPPKKQSQLTFMALLFFIEHFFLLLFIGLRDVLKRRKSEADIFLQRKDYKRRIKKNLPKNVLDPLIGSMLIVNWIQKQGPKDLKDLISSKDTQDQVKNIQLQQPNKKMLSTKSTEPGSDSRQSLYQNLAQVQISISKIIKIESQQESITNKIDNLNLSSTSQYK